MNNTDFVYIILVNYNSKGHTLECLESLKEVTYPSFQVIVVDNGSTDGCREEVTVKFPDAIWIQNRYNMGFAEANNKGILYAKEHNGQYILLLNNDTAVEPDFLSVLVTNYKKNPEIGIATGKILYYHNHSIVWYAGGWLNDWTGSSDVKGYGKFDKQSYGKSKYCTFASGCCMLLSMEIIEKIGLMSNEYFLYYEDTDYSYRVRTLGFKVLYCSNAIIYHKESVTTKKRSPVFTYYLCRNRLLYIKKNIGSHKIIAYCYTLLWFLKKMVTRQFSSQYVLIAMIDFIHNISGKRNLE